MCSGGNSDEIQTILVAYVVSVAEYTTQMKKILEQIARKHLIIWYEKSIIKVVFLHYFFNSFLIVNKLHFTLKTGVMYDFGRMLGTLIFCVFGKLYEKGRMKNEICIIKRKYNF